jgi:hypothetical protein
MVIPIVKYEIDILELDESTNLNDNNVKVDLRSDTKYAFTDQNGFKRSSLNFVENGKKADCPNSIDPMACTDNINMKILDDGISDLLKKAVENLAKNETSQCTSESLKDFRNNLYSSVFVHEIFHNLGGLHNDVNVAKEMQSFAYSFYHTSQPNMMKPCAYFVNCEYIEPTAEGSEVLINNHSERNKIDQNGKGYGGTGGLFKRKD